MWIETPLGLKESAISVSSDDPSHSKFWASALKEVKEVTHAGVWAVSPHTAARSLLKKHRYTEGAQRFAASGGKLLPLAGWNRLEIDHGPRG